MGNFWGGLFFRANRPAQGKTWGQNNKTRWPENYGPGPGKKPHLRAELFWAQPKKRVRGLKKAVSREGAPPQKKKKSRGGGVNPQKKSYSDGRAHT